MNGGLLQLVAYGAQDIYLTGNPQITYFKVVYRRHTNFAMESIFLAFNSETNFGQLAQAIIPRSGDLINGITLEAVLPALPGANARWTDDVGHHLLKRVDIFIGGQLIDRHYSDWLEIWAQLTVTASHKVGYRQLIGQGQRDVMGQPMGLQRPGGPLGEGHAETRIYVPLQFWFCRNVGLSLPLIALQYHEVRLQILFESVGKLALRNGESIDVSTLLYPPAQPPIERLRAELWIDYIFLDTDERRRFAQTTHEYLIDQLQYQEQATLADQSFISVDLPFNHPAKELLWVWRSDAATNLNQLSNYTNVVALPMITKDNIKEPGMPTIITDNEYIMRIPDYFESQGLWYTQPKAVQSYFSYRLSYRGGDLFGGRWSLPDYNIHELEDNDILTLAVIGDPLAGGPTTIGSIFTVHTSAQRTFRLKHNDNYVSTTVNSDNWGFFKTVNSYYFINIDTKWARLNGEGLPIEHGLETDDELIITHLGTNPGTMVVGTYYVKRISDAEFELYNDIALANIATPSLGANSLGWHGQNADSVTSYKYRIASTMRRWYSYAHTYPMLQEYENGDIIYLSKMGTHVSTVFELQVPYTVVDCHTVAGAQTFLLTDDNGIVEDLIVTMTHCAGGTDSKQEILPVDGIGPMDSAKLVINGTDRFARREGGYFNRVQTYRHHTNIPDSPGIYCYSFAVRPEGYQPTGTCNFSRLDTAKMLINMISDLDAGSLKMFCVTCNVLRIMSGMGGLAYMS